MKTLTPFGVKDLIPEDAEKQEKILKIIRTIFEKHKFQKIITPTIEYYDSLILGMGDSLDKKAIKFFDSDGNTLILRPDYTTPIARVIASKMRHLDLPIKLYYMDSVFRKPQKGTHEDIEIFQAGIELIGKTGPVPEAEVLAILCETLLKLGFQDFGIDIGHTDFMANLSAEKKEALLAGNYVAFGKIPQRGGAEILDQHPELIQISKLLKQKGYEKYIHFNKGLIKDMSYYTGIIFECYVKGIGKIVGSGGRYDHLIEKFGFSAPAVGFSLDINLILSAGINL